MAEHRFQEVMRQLNRMCSHYPNCDESGCPMFDECGNIGEYCSDPKHSYRIEKTVMAWAIEHPEPVYPTWAEWLVAQDIITEYGRIECGGGGTCGIFTDKGENPIPADIAQKLGIEPKEG